MPNLELLEPETPATHGSMTLTELLESLPDVRRKIAQAWIDGLGATKWAYDLESKKKVVEPDHKLRGENASKLAAYLEGMPGQTLIVKTPRGSGSGGRLVGDDQEAAFDAAMAASPALREAMRKRLERAERAAK
jgi:hypothetical protein